MAPQSILDVVHGQHTDERLAKWLAADVCSWLLRGFSSGKFTGVSLLSEPSPPIQIGQMFQICPADVQSKMKEGVARALAEWTPGAYDFSVFSELARTAAHLRATQAVPHIAQHLLSPAFDEPRDEAVDDACEIAISVLHGFIPLESVTPAFLLMFRSEHFEKYGAHFFLGLCEAMPRRFANLVPRFMALVKHRPADFELPFIMREFERIVPREFVWDRLSDLVLNSKAFVNLIGKHTSIPLTPLVPEASSAADSLEVDPEQGEAIFDYLYEEARKTGVAQQIKQATKELRERMN
jgi:hypothetical protein